MQLVRADGETLRAIRPDLEALNFYSEEGEASAGDVPFEAAALSLGLLGVVTSLTLDVVPAYNVHQRVLQGVAMAPLIADRATLLSRLLHETGAMSLFVDFKKDEIAVGWLRDVVEPEAAPEVRESGIDAAADRSYFEDPSRCGFDPTACVAGSAAALILSSDSGASIMRSPVAFLESGTYCLG